MSDRQLSTRPDLQPIQFEPVANAMSAQQLLAQVALIQHIMSTAMKDGEHFGKIPGCGDKPTLLKPGAEKLCMTFRLSPQYQIDERNLDGEHREYRVVTTLLSIGSNANIGQGVGCCSTKEAKYRYRGNNAEPTDRPVPRAYWDLRQEDPAKAQELLGGKGFTTKKVDGKGWMIAKGGEKVENDNPADCYNTVLKMAKKRALVDAVLTATAASDIFTQDLEEIMAHDAQITAREEKREGHSRANHRQEQPRQLPPPQEAEVVCESIDWREVRVHFGKNHGHRLEELSPQQTRWYWEDWMPKKEAGNSTMSIEDIKLIDALKAWRQERNNAKPQAKTVPPPVQPQPEDESQEPVPPFETLKAKAGADNITPDELADYLRAQKNGQGRPLLGEDEAVINLSDERILALLTKWDKHRTSIHAARKKRLADELSATAPLNNPVLPQAGQ